MEEKVYRLKKSVITVREDGILEIASHENQCIDIEDYTEGLAFLERKFNGKRFPVLFIPGEDSEVTNDFRKMASSEVANPYAIAEAVVVETLPHRMVSNFYMRFNKPVRPTRIFDNKEEAIEWLKSQKQ